MEKNKIIKSLLLIIFCFLSLNTFCQDFELAGIKYLNYPRSSTNSNVFSIQEFGAFFNIPTKLKNNKTILVNGLGYGQVIIKNYENSIADLDKNISLHVINYRFMLIHKLNKKWSFVGVLEPSLASDFKSSLSSDDFVFQSSAMVLKIMNPKFKIGGGLAYTTRLGKPLVIPVIPIHFKSNNHRINAVLPTKLIYAYKMNPKLDIGVKSTINGGFFNITGYSREMEEIDKINYSRTNIGPVIYYKPFKIMTLELNGGISTNRKFNLIDINNNTIENTTSTEPFFNIGLVIKP